MRTDYIIILMLIIVVATLLYDINLHYGRQKMYDTMDVAKSHLGEELHGLYSTDSDIICMKAKAMEIESDTKYHEYCHYLIDNDRDHFCGE